MEHPHLDIQTLQVEISGKLERMMDGIDTLKDRQEDMAKDVSKIKEAVYHPDEGIYARLRELEQWKKTSSKIIWMLVAALGSLIFSALKQQFLT
jgi:predicted  nucleic acid-binding Zn-ribbon protein